MMIRWCARVAVVLSVVRTVAHGDDRSIVGRKLLLLDHYAAGKAKLAFTASDRTPGAIHHGSTSGNPADLSGSVRICLVSDPTNVAVYDLPSPWLSNTLGGARYLNGAAQVGGAGARTVTLSANRTLKVVGKTLGDGDAASGDDGPNDLAIHDGAMSCSVGAGDVVNVEVTIDDAASSTTHRMCTAFVVDSVALIGGGAGCKVGSSTSIAGTCGACGPPTTTTTLPPPCGAPGDPTCSGTCTAGMVCTPLSFGPAGSGCGCVAPPVCMSDGFGGCGGNCPPACLCFPSGSGPDPCQCVCL